MVVREWFVGLPRPERSFPHRGVLETPPLYPDGSGSLSGRVREGDESPLGTERETDGPTWVRPESPLGT